MKLNVRKYLGVFLLFLGALILIQNLNLFKSDLGSIVGASIYGVANWNAGISKFLDSVHKCHSCRKPVI